MRILKGDVIDRGDAPADLDDPGGAKVLCRAAARDRYAEAYRRQHSGPAAAG